MHQLAEFGRGVRTGIRHWISAACIIALFLFSGTVFTLTFSQSIEDARTLRLELGLLTHDPVLFTPRYLNESNAPRAASEATVRGEVGLLLRGEALSEVTGNLSPSTVGGYQVVLLIGRASSVLFPEMTASDTGARVFIGPGVDRDSLPASTRAAGPPISLTDVPRLRSTTRILDAAGAEIDTSNAIVLVLPASAFATLPATAQQEALWKTILISPSPSVLSGHMRRARHEGLLLIPHPLRTSAPAQWRQTLAQAVVSAVGLGVLLILVGVAFSASLRQLLDDQQASLSIRHLYGTRPSDEASWLLGIVCVEVLPSCALLACLRTMDPTTSGANTIVIAAIALIGTAVWLAALLRLRRERKS